MVRDAITDTEVPVRATGLAVRPTGLAPIDATAGGIRSGEVWVHAAFMGEYLTTIGLNWVYYQAVQSKLSTIVVAAEMPFEQVRRVLLSFHTMHAKFQDHRGRYLIVGGIDAVKIRDNTLTPAEAEFLREVTEDFFNPQNGYGSVYHVVPDALGVEDLQPVLDACERTYHTDARVETVMVDRSSLFSPEALHKFVRFALNHNIGLVLLETIGRANVVPPQPPKSPETLGHCHYDLTAIRAELAEMACMVTTSYQDEELRAQGVIEFQCLKARQHAPFPPFLAQVEMPARRISFR